MLGKKVDTDMDYPEEWNELPEHERKKKLSELRREREQKAGAVKRMRNRGLIITALVLVTVGFIRLTQKSPEQIAFEQQVKAASLEGRVEEFPIEGRDHVPAGTDVEYQTNPPSSGAHLGQAENRGIYDKEIDDKAGVHNLEHGGIWISYKDISEEDIAILKEISKQNSQSTVVSLRSGNDDKIVIASWGKLMRFQSVDKAMIQKYIDSYKNQAPEKLAR